MDKKYQIYVKYTKGELKYTEYHLTNWGSNSADRAIKNCHAIMSVMEVDGAYRFTGVKVFEDDKCIYKLEVNS